MTPERPYLSCIHKILVLSKDAVVSLYSLLLYVHSHNKTYGTLLALLTIMTSTLDQILLGHGLAKLNGKRSLIRKSREAIGQDAQFTKSSKIELKHLRPYYLTCIKSV